MWRFNQQMWRFFSSKTWFTNQPLGIKPPTTGIQTLTSGDINNTTNQTWAMEVNFCITSHLMMRQQDPSHCPNYFEVSRCNMVQLCSFKGQLTLSNGFSQHLATLVHQHHHHHHHRHHHQHHLHIHLYAILMDRPHNMSETMSQRLLRKHSHHSCG